ncbi:MAG: cobalt-precorrin 5A hydrolase [Ruminiclostridium sp.]
MKISIISFTEKGRILSQKISGLFSEEHGVKRYCYHKKQDENSEAFSDIKELVSRIFYSSGALIFICACGIAVRSIAPFIRSKATDPAVIVIDDCGSFVIPILSGHLGGANRLAEIIAEKTGAKAVITTATDIGGAFSPDSFAKANNLVITNLSAAKEIAAVVLDNEKIGLVSDYECKNIPPEIAENTPCRTGICISSDCGKKPFEITLNLLPKNICIGIGCKRGTPCNKIEAHIFDSLLGAGIDKRRLCCAATIDIKADEAGIIEFCKKNSLKLITYTAEQLMSASGDFKKSDFVLSQTGTDNVCERSAVLTGGRLIMPKMAANGVTVAAAELPTEIDFEKRIL